MSLRIITSLLAFGILVGSLPTWTTRSITRLDEASLSMEVGKCQGEILQDPEDDCVGPNNGEGCKDQDKESCVGGHVEVVDGLEIEVPRVCVTIPGGCESGAEASDCTPVSADVGDGGSNGTAINGTGLPCGSGNKKACRDKKSNTKTITYCKAWFITFPPKCAEYGTKTITLPYLFAYGCEDDPNGGAGTVSCGGNYTKYMGTCS